MGSRTGGQARKLALALRGCGRHGPQHSLTWCSQEDTSFARVAALDALTKVQWVRVQRVRCSGECQVGRARW